MLLKPNDLGEFSLLNNVAENCQKIKIEDYVRRVNRELKKKLLESELEVDGVSVCLVTSRMRFEGERVWFECPICKVRRGVIYKVRGVVGCRKCSGLVYRKQRFKEMVEGRV